MYSSGRFGEVAVELTDTAPTLGRVRRGFAKKYGTHRATIGSIWAKAKRLTLDAPATAVLGGCGKTLSKAVLDLGVSCGRGYGYTERMSLGRQESAAHARPRRRTVFAYGLVLLSPVVAWVAWVSWSHGNASDAMHVLWFGTVALGCLIAGGLAPRSSAHFVALMVIAIVSTMVTLFLWWSAADITGMFMVGIIIATPLVVMAVAVVLLLGRSLAALRSRSFRR